MIIATHYAIKGIKKSHKKYKANKAEKEKKFLEERGQLPDLQDPSRELDMTCLAETEAKQRKSSSNLSHTSSTSSGSSRSAEKALEDDPGFKAYMDKHKSLYLQQQSAKGLPPSYDAVMDNVSTPTSSSTYSPVSAISTSTSHCNCHECIVRSQSNDMSPGGREGQRDTHIVQELPAAEMPRPLAPRASVPTVSELYGTSAVFELPGHSPAIMPEKRQGTAAQQPFEVS